MIATRLRGPAVLVKTKVWVVGVSRGLIKPGLKDFHFPHRKENFHFASNLENCRRAVIHDTIMAKLIITLY